MMPVRINSQEHLQCCYDFLISGMGEYVLFLIIAYLSVVREYPPQPRGSNKQSWPVGPVA